MSSCTLFSGFVTPVEDKLLPLIIKDIREGKFRADIQNIRSLIASGNNDAADKLKLQLPAFTPSATYRDGRKTDLLHQYSGYIHLDFDKLDSEELQKAFQKIIKIPYTYACFRSPSGKGLKVFVEVDSGPDQHALAYQQVTQYFEKSLGIISDPKCKDITRLCFVSYDPDAFFNPDSLKFNISKLPPVKQSSHKVDTSPGFQELFEECILFTEQKDQYFKGNRNNFIYLLACNCNRKGIPESFTLDAILASFDLSDREIRAAVKSAYNNHTGEFANFAKTAGSANKQHPVSDNETTQEGPEEDFMKATPTVPDDIIDQLPGLLNQGAIAFTDTRERDVFLTGALVILSGCLPNVSGVYDRQTVYPNLFAFIISPAASGKSALKFAKNMANKLHDDLLQTSRQEQQQFQKEINDYKARQRGNRKNQPTEDPPEQPLFKVLFIPANSSYAKMLYHLDQNKGAGIICETEADTMGTVLKQEWGSYSDLLRKAFHHERVSSSKKTNNEYIEVNEPRLAVALSGTPGQIAGLINSAEDGLFSRNIFYIFKVDQVWRDVSPFANPINLTEHFNMLSGEVFNMIRFLDQSPTLVEFSETQWNKLNTTFAEWLSDVTAFTSDDAGSIVKRLGLILFRIAMVLTAIRKYENRDPSNVLTCSDLDFSLALKFTELYLQHSLVMFNNLPRSDANPVFRHGNNKRRFFDALPNEFTRAQAIEIGQKFMLSVRSVDSLLKSLLSRYLHQPRFGHYCKI